MEPLTSSCVRLGASTSFEAAKTKRLVDPIRTMIQSPTKTCSTEMRLRGKERDKAGRKHVNYCAIIGENYYGDCSWVESLQSFVSRSVVFL